MKRLHPRDTTRPVVTDHDGDMHRIYTLQLDRGEVS